jgi:hypothetical protein
MQLTPLSREAVQKWPVKKAIAVRCLQYFRGKSFYVNEILSSYSLGVPDNIKDSIISAYNREEENTRQIWELLSVIPGSFEVKYLKNLTPCMELLLNGIWNQKSFL